MATNEEMDVLNWFLGNHSDLFPGVTAIGGTLQEDWAGTDAWLMKEGQKIVSVGIRRHADEVWERYFTLRIRQGGIDPNRFEFAKLAAGGGPQFYLQAWGYLPNNLSEFVFISVKRLRASDCFLHARRNEFWGEDFYHSSQTAWATMSVTKLHSIPNCVIISDVHNRGAFRDPILDADIMKDFGKQERFRVRPREKPE